VKPDTFLGLSTDIWAGAILGAAVGSILIPFLSAVCRALMTRWQDSRPKSQLFQRLANNEEVCTVFIRDFVLPEDSKILAVEPRRGIGQVQNVHEFWADVDARALGHFLNALGQAGKRKNIKLERMSHDKTGTWDTHMIVIGGQSQKSLDFYERLKHVSFKMDAYEIIDVQTGKAIPKDNGYGYGIILKAKNPYKTPGADGIAFLIGGFGTLGTAAAGYYFAQHLNELGRQFKTRCFGIVVRASVTAGEEAVERLRQFDRTGPAL